MAGKLVQRIAPSVPFTLEYRENGGQVVKKQLTLTLDLNAMIAIEDKVPGLNLLNSGGFEIFTKMNARVLGAALWGAALLHHQEYWTEDEHGELTKEGFFAMCSLVDMSNAVQVAKGLREALLITMPKDQADRIRAAMDSPDPTAAGGDNPPAIPPSSSTGSPSGPSAGAPDSAMTRSAG